MILMLDFVAERYGMLPSQVLKEGNSLDFVIAEAAQGYKNKTQAEAQARARGETLQPKVPKLSQEEMMKMLERAKEQAK
jgi:hypothetical protein